MHKVQRMKRRLTFLNASGTRKDTKDHDRYKGCKKGTVQFSLVVYKYEANHNTCLWADRAFLLYRAQHVKVGVFVIDDGGETRGC